jgi:hypothetical protein
MGNLATLAEPFTRENARENQIKAVRAYHAGKKAKILALEQLTARPAIEPEIHRITRALQRYSPISDEYARLVTHLDKLWSKAFPVQAAVRSGRSRREYAPAQPVETPQGNSAQIKDSAEKMPVSPPLPQPAVQQSNPPV